jgi:hypothetical protein
MYRRRGRRRDFYAPVIGAIIALVIIALLAWGYAFYENDPVTFTVTGKESIAQGGDQGGHTYRVYTNRGTFVVEDSIIKLRFDSADEYGALHEGRTYHCDSFGFRIPIASAFKNIVGCEEVSR